MSAKTETIRAMPRSQDVAGAVGCGALVGTLPLGLVLGRVDASAGAESTFQGRNAAPTVCHVSKHACGPRIG